MECIFRVAKMRNPWICSMDASGLIRKDLGGGLRESHSMTRYCKKIFGCKKVFSACSIL